jgi:hypothetical protein
MWKSRFALKNDDLYTIAGAKKKLQNELRETSRLKIVHAEPAQKDSFIKEVKLPEPQEEVLPEENFENLVIDEPEDFEQIETMELDEDRREALTNLAAQLLELREMLKINKSESAGLQQRRY